MMGRNEVIGAFMDVAVRGDDFLKLWEDNERVVSLDELIRITEQCGDFTAKSVLKNHKKEDNKVRALKAEFYYGLEDYYKSVEAAENVLGGMEMRAEPPQLVDTFGDFKNNCAIAVNSKGLVYVVDNDEACIYVYSPEGKPLRRIGEKAEDGLDVLRGDANRFLSPCDIAVNADDSFWVLEDNVKVLQFYDGDGIFRRSFRLDRLFERYSMEIYSEGLAREYRQEPDPPTRFLAGFEVNDDYEVRRMHQIGIVTLHGADMLYLLMGTTDPCTQYGLLATDTEKYAVRNLTGANPMIEREKYKPIDRIWIATKDNKIAVLDGSNAVLQFYDNRMNPKDSLALEKLREDFQLLFVSFDREGRAFAQNGVLISVHDAEGKVLTCFGQMLDRDYTHSLGVIRGIAFAPDNKSVYVNSQLQGKVFKYEWKT